MIYLYGLSDAPFQDIVAAIADKEGLQGPLQLAPVGPWTMIFSDHDGSEILPKRRLLLGHTKALESVLHCGTLLPARFGLVAKDLAQVRDLANRTEAFIRSEFTKIAGTVEIGVRVLFEQQPVLDATLHNDAGLRAQHAALKGKGPEAHFAMADFGGKLADAVDRRRGQAQRQLLSALRPFCRDHVLRVPEVDTEVLRAEFQIVADQQSAFQTALEAAVAALDFAPSQDPAITLIGPVPMYNFVNLNLRFDTEMAAA